MSWLQHSPPWKGCSGGSWHSGPPVPLLLFSWWATGARQAEAVLSFHVLHPLFSSLTAYTCFALCLNLTTPYPSTHLSEIQDESLCTCYRTLIVKNPIWAWAGVQPWEKSHLGHCSTQNNTWWKDFTPLVAPGCLFQMHWSIKVISKNTRREERTSGSSTTRLVDMSAGKGLSDRSAWTLIPNFECLGIWNPNVRVWRKHFVIDVDINWTSTSQISPFIK